MVMDREARCAAIHGVTKSWRRLSDWTELKEMWGFCWTWAEIQSQGLLLCGIASSCPHAGVALWLFRHTVHSSTAHRGYRGNAVPWSWAVRGPWLCNSHPNIRCQHCIPLSPFFSNENLQIPSIRPHMTSFISPITLVTLLWMLNDTVSDSGHNALVITWPVWRTKTHFSHHLMLSYDLPPPSCTCVICFVISVFT